MDRGGTETWLVNVLRQIDRGRFQMDFLVHRPGPFAYDGDLRDLGARTILCPASHRPLRYSATLRRILRDNGPYDVVHSHVHHYSGIALRVARKASVPLRIAHSHQDTSAEQKSAGLVRRFYFRLMARWIRRNATLKLAASHKAASALFGPDWERQEDCRVLYCGIDVLALRADVSAAQVREELGIPLDAFVLGHVGRMTHQKNHKFLIEIAAEVIRREPRARLLLLGGGELRGAIEQQVRDAGIADRVVFAGVRPDVARLMLGAMDVFVFPSHFEGLGLAAVEAQAAGLPSFLSSVIPEEAAVVPLLVERLPLSEPAGVWAGAILAARKRSRISRQEAWAAVDASPFNVQTGVRQLTAIYQQGAGVDPTGTQGERAAIPASV
jgi:glycosyltransferase involved in cell wall biosynthesis